MIRSPQQLERWLNADLPGWLGPGSAPFRQTMNAELAESHQERPAWRFTVVPWSETGLPRGQYAGPLLVMAVSWRGNRAHVYLADELFQEHRAQSRADRWTDHAHEWVHLRAFVTLTALTFASRRAGAGSGQVVISLSDIGEKQTLSFGGNHPEIALIPDPQFLQSLGYAGFRAAVERQWIPWTERTPAVFWRGAANGVSGEPDGRDAGDWSWLPRVHLCHRARELSDRYPLDARITGVSPFLRDNYPSHADRIGPYCGEAVQPIDFMRYRYVIDIDGWGNSWSGLFQKLLTGSTVLKVASPGGQRQWYYERLQPWEHYVPVASDLSDLEGAVEYVLSNQAEARAIGERGRQVALAATLDREVAHMAGTLAAFLRHAP